MIDAIKYTVGIVVHDVRHTVNTLRDFGNLGSGGISLLAIGHLLKEGNVKRGDYGVSDDYGSRFNS